LGEFNPEVQGGYENVKTFPLEVRKGRGLTVRVDAKDPVDIAISDYEGRVVKFEEGVTSTTLGQIVFDRKFTAALVLGIFRGDKTEVEIEAWLD